MQLMVFFSIRLMNLLKIVSLALLLFTHCNIVAQAKEMTLNPGLWEGVFDDYGQYNILEIKDSGEHVLHRIYLKDNLRVKQLKFSEDELTCAHGQCQININTPNNKESLRLILSPKFEGGPLVVFETPFAENNYAITSLTYELEKNKGPSTFHKFVERFSKRIHNQDSDSEGVLSGLWLGTVKIGNNVDMLVFDASGHSTSHFIRYINGLGITNETSFEPKDVKEFGDALLIETSHRTFANKLIVHRKSKTTLDGYFYSYHKGQLLQTGTFAVTKLKLKK